MQISLDESIDNVVGIFSAGKDAGHVAAQLVRWNLPCRLYRTGIRCRSFKDIAKVPHSCGVVVKFAHSAELVVHILHGKQIRKCVLVVAKTNCVIRVTAWNNLVSTVCNKVSKRGPLVSQLASLLTPTSRTHISRCPTLSLISRQHITTGCSCLTSNVICIHRCCPHVQSNRFSLARCA